jgi:hypothetical protein
MSRATTEVPSVDVLMCAYNYGRYVERALLSALSQDYPAERLRVIVVDDGSTDDTAATVAAIAERHPGRVLLISQANGGLRAAMNRALETATADLVALLDADDVWLPGKTAVQVRVLQDEPAVGLVFSDMTVVDGDEQLVRPSQVGNIPPFPREALAWLLVQNVATQSSIVIRRELARPLPEGITYSDWWLALCAAEVAQVAYLPEKLGLYREHGANLTSSVTGAAAVREYRKEIRFHLWTLRHLAIEGLTAAELQQIWQAIEFKAQRAVHANGSLLVELVGADEIDSAEAQTLRDESGQAADRGDTRSSLVLLCRSLAWNPLVVGGRAELDAAVQAAGRSDPEPDPFEEAAAFVVLVTAEDLLSNERLLVDYAGAVTGIDGVTLAIDATQMVADDAERGLQELLERLGLDTREDLDLLAIVGDRGEAQRQRMRSSAAALLSTETVNGLAALIRAQQR